MNNRIRRILSFILVLCMISSTVYLNHYSMVSAEENNVVEDNSNDEIIEDTSDSELSEETISNDVVSITGKLPKDSKIKTKEMTSKQLEQLPLENKEVVFAYDITLLVDGKKYQPKDKVKIELKNHKENDLDVLYVETDQKGDIVSTSEMDHYKNDLDYVEFETNSFSYYVATAEQINTIDLNGLGVKELIDANELLMKWKATKESAAITLNNVNYNIDDNNYEMLYQSVYNAMLKKATIINSIEGQTINNDTIWNIDTDVVMNGNITINNNGRLVMLGKGKITRNGVYSITNQGSLYLQGDVVCDGGGASYNERFVSSTAQNNSKSFLYLADNFTIQNFQVENKDGAGIYGSNTNFYMIGGIIGSKDVTIEWDDNQETKYGDATEKYLQTRENEYPYIKKIESNKGCFARHTDTNEGTPKGGGIALNSSTFYMSSGSIVGNGVIGECKNLSKHVGSHGGGADFQNTNVYVTGGNFSANQSSVKDAADNNMYQQYSGAIQLERSTSQYECSLSNVEISFNYSQMWVGAIDIYPGYTLNLYSGTVLKYNCSRSNSGAIAIDGTYSNMNMYDGAIIKDNHAGGLGAGIRCLGTFTMNGGEITHNMSNGDAAGLSIQTDSRQGNAILKGGKIYENYSSNNGGGIGIVIGVDGKKSSLSFEGTEVYNNEARVNGGGIYTTASHGNITSSFVKGQIRGNKATNGAGIYIDQRESCNTTIEIGSNQNEDNELIIQNNKASNNGGGMYFSHIPPNNGDAGSINASINSGLIQENDAKNDGGAMYLDSGNLTINGGKIDSNSVGKNGAGTFVKDGYVHMFGGKFISNKSKSDGGGMYISSNNSPANVIIRSGEFNGNIAGNGVNKGNGGAIAVESNNSNTDHVELGLLESHNDINFHNRTFSSFDYTDNIDNEIHHHESCPLIENNTSFGNGGAIYMNSKNSKLLVYCLYEKGNTSKENEAGNSVMTLGGKVVIGDEENNTSNARGNIYVESSMLVEGGNVDIYGNMDNPYFANDILVEIKNTNDEFTDHRVSISADEIEYKIHYFENFKENKDDEPTGIYMVKQFSKGECIEAEGVNFNHPGWSIIGWSTKEDKDSNKITYKIGGKAISDGNDYSAWKNGYNSALELYAIWERNIFTVKFDANETGYTGSMGNQQFTYGINQKLSANQFKVRGKQFKNWNTQSDGRGTSYAEEADGSKITTSKDLITLYAQWEECKHPMNKLTYTPNNQNHSITESCECGNHTATVSIINYKSTIYYNGIQQPINYSKSENIIANEPTVTYEVYNNNAWQTSEIPIQIGRYRATLQFGKSSVHVEYEIINPSGTSKINSYLKKGQEFSSVSNNETIDIYQDDSFSLYFNNYIDNTSTFYSTAPTLSFGNVELPTNTIIIMKAGNDYFYKKLDSKISSIEITEFNEMGKDNSNYTYTFTGNQEYYFIVDFSKCSEYIKENTIFNVKMVYHDSNNASSIEGVTQNIQIKQKQSFSLSASENNSLNVLAPSNKNYRWKDKNLYLKLKTEDIPSDASLNIKIGNKNSEVKINKNKEFIISLDWNESQEVKVRLNSSQINKTKFYIFVAELDVGSKGSEFITPVTNENVSLTCTVDNKPYIGMNSSQRIISVKKNTGLSINFNYDNNEYSDTENSNTSLFASNIEMKNNNGDYSGTYLTETKITSQSYNFPLRNIRPGSYRLVVTLKKDGVSVLTDYYYFIVKD